MTTKPSFSLETFLPYRLSLAANAVSDAVAETYGAVHGLRRAEWRLLAVLAEAGPLTPLSLAQRTRMDKVTVSRAALALTERGLFDRSPNPADQRSHLLRTTARGRAIYDQVVPRAEMVEARIFNQLTADERETLRQLLARVEAAAQTQADL